MEKINFETLASKYGLTVDFVKELHEKVIDKENFARAVRMFAVGLLPYDMATGKAPHQCCRISAQGRPKYVGVPAQESGKHQSCNGTTTQDC